MKYSASHLTPFPLTFPGKITCKRILSAKNSARAPASPLSTFRMNTCKSVSKQRTLSPFRMNTYAKTGGRGPFRRCVVVEAGLYARLASVASAPRCFPHSIQFKSICYRFVFISLQNPPPASPLYSHPYKTPGLSPHLASQVFSVPSVPAPTRSWWRISPAFPVLS
jgi:hypothetical protein